MNVLRIKSINTSSCNRHRYHVKTTNKVASIRKNHHIQKRNNTIRANSLNNDIVSMSYFVGKGIIAFTFFYTTLNYFFYKQLREDYEEDNKNNENK